MITERLIGEKMRQLRDSLQISVEELAEKSQNSIEFIRHIEEGQLLPSLAPLMRIARALGVRLGTFLDDDVHLGPVVTRGGDTGSVMRFSGVETQNQSELDFYSLAQQKKDRHMEPFLVDVHPKADKAARLSSHEGEEFLYVLKGAIQVAYGKETYMLHEGDSIYYDSVVPHEVRTLEDKEARILGVVYTPW
jgi:transcriptional regulator with XRE-family HTH domain